MRIVVRPGIRAPDGEPDVVRTSPFEGDPLALAPIVAQAVRRNVAHRPSVDDAAQGEPYEQVSRSASPGRGVGAVGGGVVRPSAGVDPDAFSGREKERPAVTAAGARDHERGEDHRQANAASRPEAVGPAVRCHCPSCRIPERRARRKNSPRRSTGGRPSLSARVMGIKSGAGRPRAPATPAGRAIGGGRGSVDARGHCETHCLAARSTSHERSEG